MDSSLEEYGEETTIHGVKESITYKGIKKYAWLLCILGCLTFGAYEILKVILNYEYSDVITKVTVDAVNPVQLFLGSGPEISHAKKLTKAEPAMKYIPIGVYGKGSGDPNVDLYLTGYSYDTVLLDLTGSQKWNDTEIIRRGKEYVSKFSSVERSISKIMPVITSEVDDDPNESGRFRKDIQIGTSDYFATITALMAQKKHLKGFKAKRGFAEDLSMPSRIGYRRPGYLISYPKILTINAAYTIEVNATYTTVPRKCLKNASMPECHTKEEIYVIIMNTQSLHKIKIKSHANIKLQMSMRKVKRVASKCQPEFMTNVPLSRLARDKRNAIIDRWQNQLGSLGVPNPQYFYNSWELSLRDGDSRHKYYKMKKEFSGLGPKVHKCSTCNLCDEYIVNLQVTRERHDDPNGFMRISFTGGTATIIFQEVHQFTIDGTIANIGGIIGLCCGLSLISIWHCLFFWGSKIAHKIKHV